MAGLDVDRFLNSKDESERSRIHAMARAATELRAREAEALAVQIANKVMKGLGG